MALPSQPSTADQVRLQSLRWAAERHQRISDPDPELTPAYIESVSKHVTGRRDKLALKMEIVQFNKLGSPARIRQNMQAEEELEALVDGRRLVPNDNVRISLSIFFSDVHLGEKTTTCAQGPYQGPG